MLTVASLFDGIGGFPLAFERAGARTVATVEIDSAAAAVSQRHFPDAAQFDDVTKVTGNDLRATGFVPERGIVTAGWPCQDFSVAGRRAGLDGARSGLWWEVARILAELRPAWFVGENVPGLLSSVCEPECEGGCMARHGGAFGAVLGSLGQLGYGVAYRVLDAQHFGVPQRRERVFIVGHLGKPWSAPAKVLLEPESGIGDSAAGGASWPDVAVGAARRTGATGDDIAPCVTARYGKGSDGKGSDGFVIQSVDTHTRRSRRCRAAGNAATGSTSNQQPADTWSSRKVVAALTSNGVGTCGADDNQAQAGHLIPITVMGGVTHTLTSEGADASEDGTGRGTPIVAYAPNVAAPLTRGSAASPGVNPPGRRQEDDVNLVVSPLALRGREGGAMLEVGPEDGPYNALRAGDGGSSRQSLIAVTSLAVAGDFSSSEDVAQTIRAAHGQPGVVSIDMRNAARATGTGAGTQGSGITENGPSYTVSATQMALPAVGYDTVVRRLTELECERLQGYPDGWTDGQSGSARYRQLGNSVAVPVVEWIARRLLAVDSEVAS